MAVLTKKGAAETRKEWPALSELVSGVATKPLREALGDGGSSKNKAGGRFAELVAKFPTKQWGNKNRPPEFNELSDAFTERVKAFTGAAPF
jgi:hypothetical protein